MYLDTEEIERPRVPPSVSLVKGIQSLYSFFIPQKGVIAARPWGCWCNACSRVSLDDAGVLCGAQFEGDRLVVPGCTRTNLTVWRQKPVITSTAAAGIANAREYQKDLWRRLRPRVKPALFACVQADELWSESERRHLRSGHHWICELGDAGGGNGSFEAQFKLPTARSWKEYKGTRYYDGDAALVVKRWFHRVDSDASGCTFAEWDPTKDRAPGAPPAAMLFSSSKLRGVFSQEKFKVLMPPALEGAGRAQPRRACVRVLEGAGDVLRLLSPETDSMLRDACIQAGSTM